MKKYIEPSKTIWPQITARPAIGSALLKDEVAAIIDDVKLNADAAVRKYSKQFDNVELRSFEVTAAEIKIASQNVSPVLKDAIAIAASNIRRFHESQQEQIKVVETATGVECWRKSIPIETVGLYIPGGTAPLFSTLLMLAIPAQIAGCKNILLCTPCNDQGIVNNVILYTAGMLGLKNIYKIGGVQAIAAMAYGTESVKAVNKIFGPGNQYVTAAKQIINARGIAIDMPAGPSELAVYAGETCIPAFVAADLLSQAEHGTDSQVLLLATNESIANAVEKELTDQLESLPRKDIARLSLQNSYVVILQNSEAAFDLINDYAPEHLIIASADADTLALQVQNAGSVFLGNFSPESAGDYASGTNHVLPTNGFAKTYSGVSVDSFVKKITFQKLSQKGIVNIGNAIELMAEAEGLYAHKNAVSIRLKTLTDGI